MQKSNPKKILKKPQAQNRPGDESKMEPKPVFTNNDYKASGKMEGKSLFITGGDSGIRRSVAVLFAKEGADVAIVYLNKHKDAKEVKRIIEQEHGKKCLLIAGDITKERFCING